MLAFANYSFLKQALVPRGYVNVFRSVTEINASESKVYLRSAKFLFLSSNYH